MSVLPQFDLPAFQQDLADPGQQTQLQTEWSNSIYRWTETALLGNPWTVLNDQNRDYYYNPLTTDVGGGQSAQITWTAFPNRILFYFSDATFSQQMAYADGGPHDDGTYGPPPDVEGEAYSPQGPRGWQDEYCEWNVRRNSAGKITRVDFTCENPEYWFTLWRVNPQTVLELYRQLVDPSVQLADLYLLDGNNQPVVERETGLPAYNPTNKWNTQMSADGVTGAVHLISPPNTLGAEIYLAAAATILRENAQGPVTNPEALITCSLYGRPNRNSDPTIGATVNSVILGAQQGQAVKVSLENPVGLYIQMPDFSSYQLPPDPNLPPGAQPSDCWQIVRGQQTLPGFPSNVNFILHARFEVPQTWIDRGVTFTVGDITIEGNPITNGAQITQTFQIGLNGLVITPPGLPLEAPQPCVNPDPPNPLPQPQALQDMNLFEAGTTSSAVTKVEPGVTPDIALLTQFAEQNSTITFPEGGVAAEVTQFRTFTSDDQTFQLYTLSIAVDENAAPGDRTLLVTNPGGVAGPAAPGLLTVVPPGSLPQTHAAGVTAAEATAARVSSEAPSKPRKTDLSKVKLPQKRY